MSFINVFMDGFNSFFDWMDQITFIGISVADLVYFNLFLALFWGFVLQPIFGGERSGTVWRSYTTGAQSGARSESKNAKRSKSKRNRK